MSREHWKISEIEGTYTELVEDGELRESQVTIPNVSFDENIRKFRDWYEHKKEERRYTNIVSGQDILNCAKDMFPIIQQFFLDYII